jgi:hypothetical protein
MIRADFEEAFRRLVHVPTEVRHDERISEVRAKLRAELFDKQRDFYDDPPAARPRSAPGAQGRRRARAGM